MLSKVGEKLPEVSIDTSNYNQSFVKFMCLVGLFTTAKLTVSGIKALREKCQTYKPLTQKQLSEKYGSNCWALIVDAART